MFTQNGRFLYLGDRLAAPQNFQGKQVLGGGENSIAVYSINQETDETVADSERRYSQGASADVRHRSEQ